MKTSLSGVWVAQIAVVALAVLAVGSEYETGQIRLTLAAMPRRLTVMTAKVIVVGGAVAVAGSAGVLASLVAARIVVSGSDFTRTAGIPPVSLAHQATLRAAVGTVAYLVLVALLAVGAAAFLRDTATTVIAVLGALYLFPVLGLVLTNPIWHHRLQRFAPMSAGLAVQTTRRLDQLAIGPLAGVGLLAVYSAVMLTAGTIAFATRDG